MNIVLVKTVKGSERPGHKYIRRIPLPTGGYKYIYQEARERTHKIIPVKKRIKKIEEVPEIRPTQKETPYKKNIASTGNSRMMSLSDKFFNLSPSARQDALNQGRDKLKSFVSKLGELGIKNRESFAEHARLNGRQILADFFGLDDSHFNSESGDKFRNYIDVSFSKDGNYVAFNYADKFFFDSINKEYADKQRPKWSMQMRMSRGITFDTQTGDVVSFPYEKFFNMNEYIDGDLAGLAKKVATQKYIATEKVDGILIHAFYDKHSDKVRLGTRAMLDPDGKGFIDTAENLMKRGGRYDDIKTLLQNGNSMILELIDPKYRVVIGYGKKSSLVLHGVRDLKSSKMLDFNETGSMAKNFGLGAVGGRQFNSFQELSDFQAKSKEDVEGFVLRFEDGSMIKAKTEAYFDKLKGLKALSYPKIAESILNGDDWNTFKYEKIKSEELFDVADKYRADVIKQSDKFNGFLTGFVDKLLTAADWESYGKQQKLEAMAEFNHAYVRASRTGVIDSSKLSVDDFRLAMNYLINARLKNEKSDVDSYNKKLMGLTVRTLATGAWMGEKLNELERSYTIMSLTKDFGGTVGGSGDLSVGTAGLASLATDKGRVYELDKEEKEKRKRQKMLED
jgi:hypothetical protein